jgi:hypothetical protein
MDFILERQKTISTPYIFIDEKKSYIKIEGRCFHEKVSEIFKETNEWLASYITTDFKILTIDCEIDYLNSSGMKLLHNMFLKMDNYASLENKIIINWITTEDNVIMLECGEDYMEDLVNIEFVLAVKG